MRRPASVRGTGNGSYSSLMSVVLLYVLLMGLVLVFSEQVLGGLQDSAEPLSSIILVTTIALPAFLAVLVVVNVVRLLRDRALGKPGVSFKIRLLVFFSVVVLLSAVPQAVLSANFIRTMLDTWYSDETGEALRSGQRLALDYYGRTVDDLGEFASGGLYRQVAGRADRVPRQVWEDVQELNPRIDGLQVFTAGTLEEQFFEGPEEARLTEAEILRTQSNTVSRDTSGGRSFLRVRSDVAGSSEENIVTVLTVMLPEAFDVAADRLSRSLESFVQIEQLRGTLLGAVFLFYLVFATPILLLALLVSFLLSDEIVRPLVNLEEATRRVAEGDFSFRILTRSSDDVGMLVQSFNQ
ncbi:MAG: HAMP domain-containing protein, partial [Spirochaetales bacterium]